METNKIKRTKFNVSLLGEKSVGKSCMVQSLFGLPFNENQIATIGVENFSDKATFDNKEYIFKIFDTAGQERYDSVASGTIKIANGFLLVFSVNNRESLLKVKKWLKHIEENVNINQKIIYLVGNKIDIPEREITNEEAVNFAKDNHMKYFETSAKTGFKIKEVFHQIYSDIYELCKKLDSDKKPEKTDNIQLNKAKTIKEKKKKCC